MKKVLRKKQMKHYCLTCKKTIVGSKYNFKSHLYTHKEIKPRFICEHCTQEFYRSDKYKYHLYRHEIHKVRPYICDICKRGYTRKCGLIKHLRTHNDNSNKVRSNSTKLHEFGCKICGIGYCENRLLVRHIRNTHFNFQAKESLHYKKLPNETWVEKVIQTDIYVEMTKLTDNIISIKRCTQIEQDEIKESENEAAYNKLNFDVEQNHYSKAVCNYCKKVMLKKSLLNHMRERHLKTKPFQCHTCNYNFNRHYQLVNHVCGQYRQRPRRKT